MLLHIDHLQGILIILLIVLVPLILWIWAIIDIITNEFTGNQTNTIYTLKEY